MAGSGLVALLAIIYMVLSYREHKNRQRQLSLVRFQRLRSGNLIVLNTLFVFSIFVALSGESKDIPIILILIDRCAFTAVGFVIQKWCLLQIFVKGRQPHNLVHIVVQAWSAPLLSGWTFSEQGFMLFICCG